MPVLETIQRYQERLEKYSDDEGKVLSYILKLHKLRVTVQHLRETGIGRNINSLRGYEGVVGFAAEELVNKWKTIVAEDHFCNNKVKDKAYVPDDAKYNTNAEKERTMYRKRKNSSGDQEPNKKMKQDSEPESEKENSKLSAKELSKKSLGFAYDIETTEAAVQNLLKYEQFNNAYVPDASEYYAKEPSRELMDLRTAYKVSHLGFVSDKEIADAVRNLLQYEDFDIQNVT